MQVSDRTKHCLALTLLAGLASYVIWHFAGRPEVDIGTDFSGIWADLWNEGPELSDNTTYYWRTGGRGGLTLDLLNLLDDTWQGEYDIAANDWEQGDPDVLTLRSEKGVSNMPCTMAFGVMKICNENYGDTGWLGINEIIIGGSNQRTIESSLAKMNDYYLGRASLEERRYTMCHELGHGFGLPHTDENFNNRDLGNCMDYTNRPRNNLLPGRDNFLRLQEMYGLPNQRPLDPVSPNDQPVTPNMFDPNNRPQAEENAPGEDKKEKKENKEDRNLRSRTVEEPSEGQQEHSELPRHLAREYKKAMAELEHHMQMQQLESDEVQGSGWRRLEDHSHGAEFVRRLGQDHHIKVQMLYASPQN
ncbi:unnamed protein product [Cylindrotheca closterium]|uniref:Peptidase M10 metallopeptidase domain-containing protein n=1 Tax=Cylindrotheca closterium TaxID=2856 RepID=A0AAD2G8F1_9STRA|nr:unnamed protein product [Cylindrotheca closterium]